MVTSVWPSAGLVPQEPAPGIPEGSEAGGAMRGVNLVKTTTKLVKVDWVG